MKTRQTWLLFLLFLRSQKLVSTKILNKRPFREIEVVEINLKTGAYLINFPVGWALIQVWCLFKGGAYSRIYGTDLLYFRSYLTENQ